MNDQNKRPDFEIALVLAGAVSAGAYTAGVIDYLLDALEKWNDAKQRGDDVPMHNVRIKVIAGASAGGMTAAMTAVEIRRRSTRQKREDKSIFYEAWVDLIDIKRLLNSDDLEESSGSKEWGGKRKPVLSLLNSSVIDEIAEKILRIEKGPWQQLPYVTDVLKVYLTLSNLRGIPYKFDLAGESGFPYVMTSHADYQYVEISKSTSDKAWERLKQAAIATGAFPIGLSSRIIHRTKEEYIERLKRDGIVVTDLMEVGQDEESNFDFVAVDGGLLNNEPLELAKSALYARERHQTDEAIRPSNVDQLTTPIDKNVAFKDRLEGHARIDKGQSAIAQEDINDEILRILAKQRRLIVEGQPEVPELAKALEELKELKGKSMRKAIIMIDPFPNISQQTKNPKAKDLALQNILIPLFSAMRSQAMFKPEELLQGTSKDILDRFLIAPLRHRKENPGIVEEHPIASGFFGGFGGFLSRDFRRHDYYLGRKNCQEFLMKYFTLPERFVRSNGVFDNSLSEGFFFSLLDKPEKIAEDGDRGSTYSPVDIDRQYPIIPVVDRTLEPTDDWPIYKQEEYNTFRKHLATRISIIVGRPLRWTLLSRVLYLVFAASLIGVVAIHVRQFAECGKVMSTCNGGVIVYRYVAIGILEFLLVSLSVLSATVMLFLYLLKVWLYQKVTGWVEEYLSLFKIDIR